MVTNSTVSSKPKHGCGDQHFDFPVKLTLISMQQASGFVLLGFKPGEIHVVSQVDLHISNILFTLEDGYFAVFQHWRG